MKHSAHGTNSRSRWQHTALFTIVAALTAGCDLSGSDLDEFFFALMVMAAIGLVLLVFEIYVIVRNFNRPAPWTMISGFILGTLNAVSFLGTLGTAVQAPGAGLLGAALPGALAVLALWSAVRARRTLKAD